MSHETEPTRLDDNQVTTHSEITDRTPIRRRWWLELSYVVGFYIVYSFIRNQFGSGGNFSVGPQRALDNAELIIDLERVLGLYIELAIQDAFIGWDWFIWAWNVFYGSAHFVVTGGVMVFLYIRAPNRYRRYRNILSATTALALFGFSLFPLMPPRLLNAGGDYGANLNDHDYVDTLSEFGGLWSFDSGTMQSISNQWAAMPSLHIAWALWCTVALYPIATTRWARAAVAVYPALTMFAIVVTGNHFWIDAVGGAIVLWFGWHIGNQASMRIAARPLETVSATPRRQ
ncbi:MAG: phosphatase PAP2 family protein [Actinobacteria bacterium]|nr:phosphatase PAP2 family protein [Actinomycetota bacterium]